MSKAVKSDGTINKKLSEMSKRGLETYTKGEVLDLLTHQTLKQCTYRTLCELQVAHVNAFGRVNCHVHRQIKIKATQSPIFRAYADNTLVPDAIAPDKVARFASAIDGFEELNIANMADAPFKQLEDTVFAKPTFVFFPYVVLCKAQVACMKRTGEIHCRVHRCMCIAYERETDSGLDKIIDLMS